ncbi:MAG: DUF5752 family protein [Parachlamydiaceae bacterium]
MDEIVPFQIKNCSIATMATGERAASLAELRDKIQTINLDSIYYHFWSRRLSSQFTHPEFPNDFSLWAHIYLHDEILAERLSILDPTDYESLEDLRAELVEIIEQRLEEGPAVSWVQKDPFNFIRSCLIIFETPLKINSPFELADRITKMSPSNIFYHFIDARSRTPQKKDDFSTWLRHFGEEYYPLADKIESIDPYFLSLVDISNQLVKIVNDFLKTKQG